ncbi:ABC transporter ATP-binding protein [Halalkalibacter alkaliphilus]|uniref:Nickel import system ATP-binding protein NikD n=1 Tax=Halalkalibacter alkaliphilus TaxID=2917993 RepID=A0A9X2CUP9_9BACI|nr:ABC transporter ATP-binding protein [Halalkalibacter alkaliphilus]MCL7748578.1 ABC transporter ATP-binding protein [Halalkalibacter alkaliphilus]
MPLLEVDELSISFNQYSKGFKKSDLKVIQNLTMSIDKGEVVAVVGSSGSGKSLLAHAILGILPSNANISGTIKYDGDELTQKKRTDMQGDEIALVPQSVNFLDPLMKTGAQVRLAAKKKDAIGAQRRVFDQYHLDRNAEKLYPFQLSGGMTRRVLVSTAVISEAKVIIADEPTPGLDPVVVKEALSSIRELADNGSAVMLITHDIGSALSIADKIAVFYAGTTVEIATVKDFYGKGEALRHPYSKALWRALPQNEFLPIPGSQPEAHALPNGCLFEPRCAFATAQCSREMPAVKTVRGGMVRCFHAT